MEEIDDHLRPDLTLWRLTTDSNDFCIYSPHAVGMASKIIKTSIT